MCVRYVVYSSCLKIPLEVAKVSVESTEDSLPFKINDIEAGGTQKSPVRRQRIKIATLSLCYEYK